MCSEECERVSYSYIKIPADYNNGSINPNCPLGLQNINQTYMGVAPRCDEFYRSTRGTFHNPYDHLLNGLEDEKYIIDMGLLRKKKLLRQLEEIKTMNEESAQAVQLERLMGANV